MVAWEDDRSGTTDVYAQNVLPAGALGPSMVPGTVGSSLRVRRSETTPGSLVLSWGGSCTPGTADYAIYAGALGSFASHVLVDCSDDGLDRAEEIAAGNGDRYYLLVTRGLAAEGSYGRDSDGTERPAATPSCEATQDLSACP